MTLVSFIVLAAGLAVAVVTDTRSRRIPNWLTGSMMVAGIALAFSGMGAVTPGQAALGIGAGLLLMLPGHIIGATGAGDVKLMAAVGGFVGPALALNAFLGTAVAGGVFAVAVAARRGRLIATIEGTGQLVTAPSAAKMEIEAPARANRFAYAPAIAVGSLVAVLLTAKW
jgi:prepilin peptidase CpaA